METLLIIFAIQGLLGAFDTIYHHELKERLPWRNTASKELILHGVRNVIYSVIFLSLGWMAWHGLYAWVFAALLGIEIVITLIDFVEEDRTRQLPPSERVTHTLLALNYGAILALLIPILWQWSAQPTGFARINFGFLSWVMACYAAGVLFWGWRDLSRGLFWRKKKLLPSLETLLLDKPNQRILVAGGTGFIGKPLCQALIDQGHYVTVITRDIHQAAHHFHGRITFLESANALQREDAFDVVINLAGETVNQRWSASAQEKIRTSRITTTAALAAFIRRANHKPDVFINSSAIGIYGTDETTTFREETPSSKDKTGAFPREVCEVWEKTAKEVEREGVRTCLLRTGIVLESDGGALAQMLFPFEFCLGGRIGSGQQWFSWIHRDDHLRLIGFLINHPAIKGAVNATAPEPATNKVFTHALSKAMKRPALLPLPAFQVQWLFGEMGKALLLSGQKVIPEKALSHGFTFLYPCVNEALEAIFRK